MKITTLRGRMIIPLLVLLGAAVPLMSQTADEPAIVGVWDVVSQTGDGGEHKVTLTVKHEDGKFVASAGTDEGVMPIADFKVDGDDVSFTATVDDNDYTVKVKVSGATFEGKWSGGDDSGTIKGTKHG